MALLNRAILFLVASLLAQTVTAQPAPTPPTPPTPAPGGDVRGTRIKDLVDVAGHRHNALVGYGLVVGLQGQGDGRVSFTSQSISGMLGRLGVRVVVNHSFSIKLPHLFMIERICELNWRSVKSTFAEPVSRHASLNCVEHEHWGDNVEILERPL